MKKIIALLTLSITLISCNEYEIKGTANGITNGSKVFLIANNEMGGPIYLDTVIVENNKFEFEGKQEKPEIGFIAFENLPQGNIPVILEKGNIEVLFDKNKPENNSISGTENNDLYKKYNEENKDLYKKANEIISKNIVLLSKKDKTDNEKELVKKIMADVKVFQDQLNKRSVKFITENNDKFVSLLLLENLFFSKALPVKEIEKYYSKFPKELLKTKSALGIKKFLQLEKANTTNNNFKDFKAPTPEGKIISLKESLGKITIVDFWASWCGPCRQENPNMVKLYNNFKDKGLKIIGVSLDKDKSAWTTAIKKDKLSWTQVSNLKEWDEPIAKLYGVDAIPCTFILDKNGNIIAEKLTGEELHNKVKELLSK